MTHVVYLTVKLVEFILRFREVPSSTIILDTFYSEWHVGVFAKYVPMTPGLVFKIQSKPLSSVSSSFILLKSSCISTLYTDMPTVQLKAPQYNKTKLSKSISL